MTDPEFTGPDWHSQHIPVWREMLAPLMGKPFVRALEIGSYEGRSARWMLHEFGQALELWCVDPFDDEDRARRFDWNTEHGTYTKMVGKSAVALPSLATALGGYFDFIYIDGSHEAPDVLLDAVMAFELTKPGGLICFDDYEWSVELDGTTRAPKMAIASFLAVNADRVDVLRVGIQVWIRKRSLGAS